MSDGMEISDFAGALRQMADNALLVAERHDVAEIAALRRQVEEQAVKAQRDGDLINELRRQARAMGRSLDAIGRLRESVKAEPADAVQILGDALLLIAGERCSTFTSGSCRNGTSGKVRGAKYGADAWCEPCIAFDALERAGALLPVVD